MTTTQLHLLNGLYLIILVVVAVLTRATARRIAGALVGGAAAGVLAPGIVALGEKAGWWHMAITWAPYFLTLLRIDFALCAFIFLITWRIARRFGWRALAVVIIAAAVIGPPRDYWYLARFPEWGAYGPGIVPVLAISATYVLLVLLGHGVMRLIAGPGPGGPAGAPSIGDRLTPRWTLKSTDVPSNSEDVLCELPLAAANCATSL
jgi:hypothetical protein